MAKGDFGGSSGYSGMQSSQNSMGSNPQGMGGLFSRFNNNMPQTGRQYSLPQQMSQLPSAYGPSLINNSSGQSSQSSAGMLQPQPMPQMSIGPTLPSQATIGLQNASQNMPQLPVQSQAPINSPMFNPILLQSLIDAISGNPPPMMGVGTGQGGLWY